MPISLTILDGAATIGGTKIYLEFLEGTLDGCGLFLDFGLNYRKVGEFFEEFLTPRPSRGIHDLLRMGVIPPISCYRQDLTPSDADLSSALRVKPLAVLASHAHLDHIGNMGLLDRSIPLVASPVTLAIAKAMQDCNGRMDSEVAYITQRTHWGGDDRLIATPDWHSAPFLGRKILLTSSLSPACQGRGAEEFLAFCNRPPSSRKLAGVEVELADGALGFPFKAFDVDHSIYGATAYAIGTDAGWIVYTGDLRMHGAGREKTVGFIRQARELAPKILVIEGTRAFDDSGSESEGEVLRTCLETVLEEQGLVIADFGPRNLERLDTFRRIANKTGRRLVVLMKDAYLLDALRCVDGEDRMGYLAVYGDLKIRRDGFEKRVMAGFSGQIVDPREIGRRGEEFIVCFSFLDIKHLLDIRPEGGTYIYSSSEAYSEEQVIDMQRLWNWLNRFGLTARGFSVDRDTDTGKVVVHREHGFHASGMHQVRT